MQPPQIITPGQTPTPAGPPPPPQPGGNQYDFIVNYNNPPGGILGGSSSTRTRIIVASTGAFILILVAWLFLALLSNTSGGDVSQLTALTQRQAELSRISTQPMKSAASDTTRSFAASTRLSTLSAEQLFMTYLARHGTALSTATLQARKNPQTDTTLQSALASGTYDQAYSSIVKSQLNTYTQALKQTYDGTHDATEKQLLGAAYADAQLLLKQSQESQ